MATTNSTTIKVKRDPAATWTANNITLDLGEPGIESDTHKMKIGNGTSTWNSLPYVSDGNHVQSQVKRDTAANLASTNPILAAGELAWELDTGITKIGDGTTHYNNLPVRATTTQKITRPATITIAASNSSAKVIAQADYVCDGTHDEVEIQTGITAGAGGKIVLLEGNYSKGNVTGITIPSNTEVELLGNITLVSNVGDGAVIFTNSDTENGNSKISIVGNGKLLGNRDNQSTGTQHGIILTNVTNSTIKIEASEFSDRAIVVTGDHNYARNLLYPNIDILKKETPILSDMLNFPGVTVLDNIDENDSWTSASGSVTWDGSVVYVGKTSAKLTMSTYNSDLSLYEASISKTFSTPISVGPNDFFGTLFRATEKIPSIYFAIELTDGNNVKNVIYAGPINQSDVLVLDSYVDNWQIFGTYIAREWSQSAQPTLNTADIVSVKIIVRSSVENSELYVDGLFNSQSMYKEGSVIITVDDGYESVHDIMAPTLAKYGWKGVTFINPGILGTQDPDTTHYRMTKEQVLDVRDAGWDVCSHTNMHIGFNSISIGRVEEEVLLAKNWLIQNGCADSAFAYPFGSAPQDKYDVVKQYYKITRATQGATSVSTFPLCVMNNIHTVNELTDGTISTIKSLITSVSSRGTNIVVLIHNVAETSGVTYSVSRANFEDFVNSLKSANVRVITFSDLLRDLKTKRASPNPNYITQKSGTATIATAGTSVVVTHGLSKAPTNVIVTPKGNVGSCWVDPASITSTQMTIHCSTAPEADTAVSWSAQVV